MLSWDFLLFLDLLDIFLFRVWMPSFFMVSGRLICGRQEETANVNNGPRPSHLHHNTHYICYILYFLVTTSTTKTKFLF